MPTGDSSELPSGVKTTLPRPYTVPSRFENYHTVSICDLARTVGNAHLEVSLHRILECWELWAHFGRFMSTSQKKVATRTLQGRLGLRRIVSSIPLLAQLLDMGMAPDQKLAREVETPYGPAQSHLPCRHSIPPHTPPETQHSLLDHLHDHRPHLPQHNKTSLLKWRLHQLNRPHR